VDEDTLSISTTTPFWILLNVLGLDGKPKTLRAS
jgi:hypothetical protein